MSCPPRLIRFFGADVCGVLATWRALQQSRQLLTAVRRDKDALQREFETMAARDQGGVTELQDALKLSAEKELAARERLGVLEQEIAGLQHSISTPTRRFGLSMTSMFDKRNLSVPQIMLQIRQREGKLGELREKLRKAEIRVRNQRDQLQKLANPLDSLRFAIDFCAEREAAEVDTQERLQRQLEEAVLHTARDNSVHMLMTKAHSLAEFCDSEKLLRDLIEMKEIDVELQSHHGLLEVEADSGEAIGHEALAWAIVRGFRPHDGELKGTVTIRGIATLSERKRYRDIHGHSRTRIVPRQVDVDEDFRVADEFTTTRWQATETADVLVLLARVAYRDGRRQAITEHLAPMLTSLGQRAQLLCRELLSTLEHDFSSEQEPKDMR